jgi:NADH:ubiquinone oxidoreductase subunit 6 (subunit J)
MIHIVLYIFLLGNYYLALIYLIIYIGSIAILFIYILMVLSIVNTNYYGYILFLLPFITISIIILGINIPIYEINIFNIKSISYEIYSTLLIPIAFILFLAMIFAIKSI